MLLHDPEQHEKRAGEWPLSRAARIAYAVALVLWLLCILFLDGGLPPGLDGEFPR